MRDREAGMTLVRRIYQAFWVEGHDISSPVELARLGGDMIAPQSNSDGKATSRRWAAAWEATGQAGVPLIVAPGGDFLIGCVPTEEIERFFTDHG